MNKKIIIGLVTLLTMSAIMAVGVISYSHSNKLNSRTIFLHLDSTPVKDTFNTKVLAESYGRTFKAVECELVKQSLLVTDDTVVIGYPLDSLKQPLLGKPVALTNENRTLICEGSNGEAFSLTYYFDPANTESLTPILILKRQSIEKVIFLSKSKECEKLMLYLNN